MSFKDMKKADFINHNSKRGIEITSKITKVSFQGKFPKSCYGCNTYQPIFVCVICAEYRNDCPCSTCLVKTSRCEHLCRKFVEYHTSCQSKDIKNEKRTKEQQERIK